MTKETRSGLVAIKSLLGRDPCAHANTAIQMIDEMLAEQQAQQSCYCPNCEARSKETKKLFGYEIWGCFYRTREELIEDWLRPDRGHDKEWIDANTREVYVHGTAAIDEREAAKKGGAA